eukprot:m.471454 g.471454  ORF g.471454 m.471454 type:complete len:590 (+) comp20375_c4_seq1:149-1918(+)
MPAEGRNVDELEEHVHKTDSVSLLILMVLLLLTVLTIWRFKLRRYRFLHETGVSMILGIVAGFFINLNDDRDASVFRCHNQTSDVDSRPKNSVSIEDEAVFDPEIFFFVLLPPIIFFAGYELKQRHFFKNIAAVIAFALGGTIATCFIIGLLLYLFVSHIDSGPLSLNDCLLFGALISATDPVSTLAVFHDLHVDHKLYAIVFGESVLNDAIAIVMYSTISQFGPHSDVELNAANFFYSIWIFVLTFFGSFAIGCFIGMCTALLTKFTNVKDFPLLETALFVILAYSSFLFGEGFGLSGIVAVLFCGMSNSHYTKRNLSEESRIRVLQFFEMLNFFAENFVFSYVGLTLFTYKCHQWYPGLIVWAVFIVIASRPLIVFPLSFILNLGAKEESKKKVSKQFQYMLVFVGLRGAIAFAIAARNTSTQAHKTIFTTTLIVVLVTVVFFGGSTVALLQHLKIRVHVQDDEDEQYEGPNGEVMHRPSGRLASWWLTIDRRYLRPVLSHSLDNWGTASAAEVKRTVINYFRGQVEERPPTLGNLGQFHTANDTVMSSSSDSENDDVDGDISDAFRGDLGALAWSPAMLRRGDSSA